MKDDVSETVGDKVVDERWLVTKMGGDKVVCERWCVTKWRVKDGVRASPVSQVPRLPGKVQVDVAKRHTCHAKRPPATQSGAVLPATKRAQARHQSQLCVKDGVVKDGG